MATDRYLIGVVYYWTDDDGDVARIGKTRLGRWLGWTACAGRCHRARRTRHRFCEEYLTKPKWAPLRRAVDWEAGPVLSTRPIPGLVTYRLALGPRRTTDLERAELRRYRPRLNVQFGSAHPARRRRHGHGSAA